MIEHLQAIGLALCVVVAGYFLVGIVLGVVASYLNLINSRTDIHVLTHISFFSPLFVSGMVWSWLIERKCSSDQ